jgi:hypothetical protein
MNEEIPSHENNYFEKVGRVIFMADKLPDALLLAAYGIEKSDSYNIDIVTWRSEMDDWVVAVYHSI